nr:molybdopterin biosynthesis protein [Calliblepharis sp.]
MLNPNLNKSYLSNEEYIIYARHLKLNKLSQEGQYRLKKAKILLIGAGGLGCPAIIYLALAGIGCLGIIDNDVVSKSDLHRQILYNNNHLNRLKTNCAKENLTKINPQCQINIYSSRLNKYNAQQLIKKYDLILDTSDNFDTRYLIDYICQKLHKVHIYGAIENFEGHISVFNYKNGPKYSDLYPKNLELKDKKCESVLNVIPGIIGILQATEAIKIITGIGKILSGYLLTYNSLNISFKKIKIKYQKINSIKNSVNQENKFKNSYTINSYELNKYIKKNKKISIIDIRQKIEFKKNHILNAIHIPLKEIKSKKNIEIIQNLSNNNIVIIYCSDNSRSIIASQILNKQKIIHYRLKDGLKKWI